MSTNAIASFGGRWRRRVKRAVARAAHGLGFEFYRDPLGGLLSLRRRLDLTGDALSAMRTILGRPPLCVFDVGAHTGETALRFAERFPRTTIYSFEPDPTNFARLVANTRSMSNVVAVRAAVSDITGDATLYRTRYSQTHSLLKPSADAAGFLASAEMFAPAPPLQVPTLTLDAFCRERNIGRVDVLKIDAQGAESAVLRGACSLVKARETPLVFIEVNFIGMYDAMPLFPVVYEDLYERGYRLVSLYDLGFGTHYYQLGCNALFVEETAGSRRRKEP